ncbi:hypothetical protein ABIE52_000702 [Rhodococcus sp. OAS809]|uniref:hypothetical protein n=1 Tax=Rhodococcus sp. OAS809 TaxID=2663874 RepID=UPI00178AE90A
MNHAGSRTELDRLPGVRPRGSALPNPVALGQVESGRDVIYEFFSGNVTEQTTEEG